MSDTPKSVVAPHFPLAAVLWPHTANRSGLLRSVILVALGTALLTLSAKVNLPLPYVPMTLQTLVVLVIGAASLEAARCISEEAGERTGQRTPIANAIHSSVGRIYRS